jgi:hypothetical protein
MVATPGDHLMKESLWRMSRASRATALRRRLADSQSGSGDLVEV